jgi:hypothetical protein
MGYRKNRQDKGEREEHFRGHIPIDIQSVRSVFFDKAE